MNIKECAAAIRPPCGESEQAARRRFSDIAIPLGSLGLLEDAVVRLAGMQRTARPALTKRAAVVFCADNGVVAQGVTQCGQEITALVTENLSKGSTSVCCMARRAGLDVVPVDIGVAQPVSGAKIRQRCVRRGTADMTRGPAMTRDECVRAVETGIAVADELAGEGYALFAAGEMGIGNTTTSAAIAAVLTGAPASEITGRGAGLSTEGLKKKISAIETAIALSRPDAADPLDVLHKVGGLDIAGLAGLYLGAAAHGLPTVLDGLISCVAALIAVRLCPAVKAYLIASHVSAEPAGRRVLEELGLSPLICAGMRLGEGTGAVAGVALIDLALAAYDGMPSFAEIGMQAYQPLT